MVTLTATETAASPSVLTRPCVGLVADALSARRIQTLFESAPLEIVASGRTVESVLDGALVSLDVAIVVGDVGLLARGGPVELLRNLRPNLPALFVAKTDDRAAVRKALRSGVHGFVSYSNLEQGLEPTVQAVLAGQLAVPQTIRSRVAWGAFSLREKQVLQLVADGLTNAEIACRLFLSESTVKSHLSSSFRKLGVASRSEAAAVVLDADTGLAPPSKSVPMLAELEQQLLGAGPSIHS